MVPGSRNVSWACSWVPSQSVSPKHELGNLLVRVLGLHLDDDFHFDTEYHLCVEIGRRTLLVRSSAIAGNRWWVRVLSEANVVVNVGSCAPTGPGELQIRTRFCWKIPATQTSGVGIGSRCREEQDSRPCRRDSIPSHRDRMIFPTESGDSLKLGSHIQESACRQGLCWSSILILQDSR